MNAFRSHLIMSLVVAIAGRAQGATVYIHPSSAWQISSWRYFKGVHEPPANWRELEFDDASWTSGKAPFGYGVRGFVRYGTVLADMKDGYTSVFLRKHFYVDDVAKTTALKLSVNYGDGFVAWLNGVQIASQNAPDKLTATSTATAKHPASAEHRYEVFPVADAPLRLGRNVLAIQLLTHGRDRTSALFDASLIDTRNLAFQRPAAATSIQRNARFFQPSAAVDGTQLTFWSSAEGEGQGSGPVSFSVDLGQTFAIDRVRLSWWGGKLPGLGGGPRDYDVQVSYDNQMWRTVAALRDQKGGEKEVTFPAVKARHVRLHMTAANAAKGSMGLLDFEVYEQGVPLDAREFDGLSLFKPATASTQPSPGSPAAKAFDNNVASWWVSQPGAADPQWLAVDLQGFCRVSAVKIYFSERFAERFSVQLALGENEWRDVDCTVDTEAIPNGDNHHIHHVMFREPQEARHARILLWGPNPHAKQYGNRYALTEFVVIGEPARANHKPAVSQPVVDSASASRPLTIQDADASIIKATITGPKFAANDLFTGVEDLDAHVVKRLREEYRLEDVVKGETSEFRKMLKLRHWVRSRWHIDNEQNFNGDVFEILQKAKAGEGFNCSHAMKVQHAVMTAMGYVVRDLGVQCNTQEFPDGFHHGVNEVWSNEYAKWVLMDGEYDFHFERDGRVLSALEAHEAARRNGGRSVVKVQGPERTVVPMKGQGFPFTSVIGYWWTSYHVRQNAFTQPKGNESRLVIFDNDAFRQTTWYRKRGDNVLRKHWAYDAKAFVPTTDRRQIEWTPGVPDLRVRQTAPGDLNVHIKSVTPNLKTTEVRIDEGDWMPGDGTLTWKLREGDNRLQVRTRNRLDVVGPIVTVAVTYAPTNN